MKSAIAEPSYPDHVPAHLVSDVDFYDLIEGDEDAQHAWWRLQQDMPSIFWTSGNGGHWIVTRAEDIAAIQIDHQRFSHRDVILPKGQTFFRSLLHMDPPEHGPFRKLITPAFLPRAVDILETTARKVAIDLIERLAPKGECEFVAEFAQVLPIVVFLTMCDLPQEDREMLLPWAEDMPRATSMEKRVAAQENMGAYLDRWITARRGAAGGDLISIVANGTVGQRPLTHTEAIGMCTLLLFAGLDTVASMLGFVARFLALNPQHRERLVREPAIIPYAVEEFVRRFGLVNLAREVTCDTEFKGVEMRKGDMVQIPNCLHGLDDRKHANPLAVDFDRDRPISHASFGTGPHTCPGAVLARRELRVFLQEWLSRIPEFIIKPGTTPKMVCGLANTVTELRLAWPLS